MISSLEFWSWTVCAIMRSRRCSVAEIPTFDVGDKVFFVSDHLHKKMGLRKHTIVSRLFADGEWWFWIDNRNYVGASYLTFERPNAFPEVR